MKLFYILLISILIQSCSFDNKTGIWKNENTITKKKNKTFKDFKSINLLNQSSEETIPIEKNYKFQLRPASNNFVHLGFKSEYDPDLTLHFPL